MSKKIGKISILLMAFLILTVALAGCGEGNPPAGQVAPGEQGNGNGNGQPSAPPVEMTVSAAASLTDVMEEIKGLYEGKSDIPWHELRLLRRLCSRLKKTRRISFISAAQKQMDTLQERG